MHHRVRNRIVLFGAVLGALLGLGTAYMFARRHEDSENEPGFSTREAISLGMELVKLLRQIGGLASRS